MRHVMTSYTWAAITLLCSLSQLGTASAQESLLWSDPQLSSEEWHPFVPSSFPGLGERNLPTYPRAETVRQFFGKPSVEQSIQNSPPLQNPSLKKSFQASAAPANNVDQYAIAPVLGTFNSFGVQTVQTRNPVFDKNIKDSHLLEQPTQYQFKYQPHPQQQVSSTVHRFPAFFPPTGFEQFQRQPSAVNLPQASFHGHAAPALAGNRYETALKQGPSRTPVATTIQVFPPPAASSLQSAPGQHTQFGQNTYYLNVPPPPKEEFVDNEPLLDRKQARPAEYHQTFNIYSTRDDNRPKPQHQSSQNAFFDNVKTPPVEKYEYDIISNSRPAGFASFGNEHIRGGSKKNTGDSNPGKQVFEQLSPLGRPFALSNDGTETDSESLGSFGSVSRPKKTKTKTTPPVSITYHRIPGGNGVNSLVDYESGKLQSVKTVNYEPPRFSEEDPILGNNVVLYHTTSEKQPPANSFLPTPLESHDNNDFSGLTYSFYNSRFTTTTSTAAPILDDSTPQLPRNHKYSPANIRHRQPVTSLWRQPTSTGEDGSKYSLPASETFEEVKTSYDNAEYEATTTPVPSTTRRSSPGRRRKPSKLKNKTRTSLPPPEVEPSPTTLEENYPRVEQPNNNKIRLSYYDTDANRNTFINTNEAINAAFSSEETPEASTVTTSTQAYTVKKKQTKVRTTTAPPQEYPNYPVEYINQQLEQTTNEPYSTEISYQQEEQRESSKINYPTVTKSKTKPIHRTTVTTPVPEATVATTSAPVQRTRSKSKPSATATSTPNTNLTRPRFSIKDYKRTTTSPPITTTSAIPSASGNEGEIAVHENTVEIEKKDNRKNVFALRNKNRNRVTTESDINNDNTKPVNENSNDEQEVTIRKYKPRVRPKYSYKISTPSTTTIANVASATDPTSERVNTFRPSGGGRIRSSTSKYYNRYRTTTEVSKNALSTDEENDHVQASSSNIKPTRTLLFSAKKSTTTASVSTSRATPSPTLNKIPEYEDGEEDDLLEDEYEDDVDEDHVLPPTKYTPAKKNRFQKKPASTKLEKADDISETSIMTSAEEQLEKRERDHVKSESHKNSTQQLHPPVETDKSEEELDLSMITMDGKEEETDQESESVMVSKKTNDDSIMSTVSTTTSGTTNTESSTVPLTTTMSPQDQSESEDDVNDRVSKVSLLTSQDESNRVNGGAAAKGSGGSSSYKHHWRFPVFSIKKISDSDY